MAIPVSDQAEDIMYLVAVATGQAQIDKYSKAAQNAVLAGNDWDARTLIAKKQTFEEQLVTVNYPPLRYLKRPLKRGLAKAI